MQNNISTGYRNVFTVGHKLPLKHKHFLGYFKKASDELQCWVEFLFNIVEQMSYVKALAVGNSRS